MWLLSALLAAALAQSPSYRHMPGETPAVLVVMPSSPENIEAEWKSWTEVTSVRKWHLVAPTFQFVGDDGVHKMAAMVAQVRKDLSLPNAPFYLAGGGVATPAVIYAAVRAPYLWSAVLAIGGTPKPAIDSDRAYAANTTHLPIAWALTAEENSATRILQNKLRISGFEFTLLENPTIGDALSFLAKYPYEPFPPKIDCEIGNPTLGRCYWLNVTKFDPSLRNDALPSTRVPPELQASLDLGGFGYTASDKGPGILVEFLLDGYKGPLKKNDRIVALSGKPIVDAAHYIELMGQVKEEKPVAITVQRGDERIRITTSYRLPQRFEVLTARAKAEFLPDSQEILLVTRGIASVEISPNPAWKSTAVNWNGNRYDVVTDAPCLALALFVPGAVSPCKAPPP